MITQEQSYLSYFTPSQMSAEMLESILVKRQNLAARLVERTKQSVLTPAKHQTLLLGPRGMGKSYLVALVYHRVKALPELADKIAIAYFAEEEWSITSLADLLLVLLKALEREYGGLQKRIEALYRLPIREIETAAGDLVREFVRERTLFLLVENLNEIFRGLGDQGEWAFRSFISERPFVTILATTPSLFAGVTEHDSAFYGFFQNIYLEELTVEEATELLEKVAQQRDDMALAAFIKTPTGQDRVQAVHDLAGGHPRIYLLFAHLLTQETLDELIIPFLKLLDELTPYYQSRMHLLSPQQRKIVEFLCSSRGTVPVKEIATQNLMTSQTASSQLDKLEDMAYVRKTQIGRESFYELREPLLRMAIEVKRGRGEPIRLIVDFLRRWYSRNERKARLAYASAQHPLTYLYLTASLDLNRAMLDIPNFGRAQRLSSEYEECFKAQQFDRACELAAEIIERKGRAREVHDLIAYGRCLYLTDQYAAASPIWKEISEHIPNSDWVWRMRGIISALSGNTHEALLNYDRALQINSSDATVWYMRAILHSESGDRVAAIASLDKVLNIAPSDAEAWYFRGLQLVTLGDMRALPSFQKAIDLAPTVSRYWIAPGIVLYGTKDYKASLTSLNRAIEIDPNDPSSWTLRAEVCLELGEWRECITSIRQVLLASPKPGKDSWMMGNFYRNLLRHEGLNEKVTQITRLYTEKGELSSLGQEVVNTIPAVLQNDVPQSLAEEWVAEWKAASSPGTGLDIPIRMLDVAVAWKNTRNVRVLMSLPIEERRILESLLPRTEANSEL